MRQGSQEIRDSSNRTDNLIQSQVQNASNKAMMLKSDLSNQINRKIGMAQQQVQHARSQALSGLVKLIKKQVIFLLKQPLTLLIKFHQIFKMLGIKSQELEDKQEMF